MSRQFRQFNGHYENIDMQYSYFGKYYLFVGTDKERMAMGRNLIIFCAVSIALCIFSGLTLAGRMSAMWYVVVPYVVEVLMTAWLTWYTVKLIRDGNKIKEPTKKKVVPLLPIIGLILGIMAIWGLVCVIEILTVYGDEGMPGYSYCYLIAKVIMAALGIFIFIYQRRFKWVEEKLPDEEWAE